MESLHTKLGGAIVVVSTTGLDVTVKRVNEPLLFQILRVAGPNFYTAADLCFCVTEALTELVSNQMLRVIIYKLLISVIWVAVPDQQFAPIDTTFVWDHYAFAM